MSVGRRVYIAQRVLEMRGTRHRWTVSGSSYSTEVHEEPINGTRKAAGGAGRVCVLDSSRALLDCLRTVRSDVG